MSEALNCFFNVLFPFDDLTFRVTCSFLDEGFDPVGDEEQPFFISSSMDMLLSFLLCTISESFLLAGTMETSEISPKSLLEQQFNRRCPGTKTSIFSADEQKRFLPKYKHNDMKLTFYQNKQSSHGQNEAATMSIVFSLRI